MMKYILCLIIVCSGLNVFGQEILLEEHFDKSYVMLPLWKTEESRIYLDHGGYYIDNLKKDAATYAKTDIEFSYNLVVEATFKLLSGSEDTSYGISLGTSKEKDNAFNFWVSEHYTNFSIGYPEKKSSKWIQTTALKKGEENRLKIEMKEGKDFYFYLNGELVYSVTDYDYYPTDYYDIDVSVELHKMGELRIDDLLAMNRKPSQQKINFVNLEGMIREKVQEEYSKWAVRGEFETTAKHKVRMEQADQKLEELTREAVAHFKGEHIESIKDYLISALPYHAEEEYFTLKSEQLAPFKVQVPKQQARGFRFAGDELRFRNFDFKLRDNAWVLSYVEVYNPIEDVSFYYDLTKEQDYNPEDYSLSAKSLKINRPD